MAGEAALSRTIQALLTTTLDAYLESNKLYDNVFDATPFWAWLNSGNRIKTVAGGYELTTAVLNEANSTARSYSGYDALDTTAQEGMTRTYLDPKQYSVHIGMNGDEITANRGEAEILDLWMSKITQGELSVANKLSEGAFSDGTGNSSKDLTGLQAMVDTTPTASTYAGINRANATWWRNQANASVGAAATNLISNIRQYYNSCAQGKGVMSTRPDAIFTTQTVHEALEALLFPMFQFTPGGNSGSTEQSANAGVTNLYYKAAEVIWDADVPSGYLYILDSNHIWLAVYRGRDLRSKEEVQKPFNQDALGCQILFKGNLVSPAVKKLGVLAGIT